MLDLNQAKNTKKKMTYVTFVTHKQLTAKAEWPLQRSKISPPFNLCNWS